MKMHQHFAYQDIKKFANARGLRKLRRQLRTLDKHILACKSPDGKQYDANIRMRVAHELMLGAEDKRRAAIDKATNAAMEYLDKKAAQ